MKRVLQLLIPIMLQAGFCNAQAFDWAKQLGSTGNDEVTYITTDASGNVLTSGYFEGTVDFDPGAAAVNHTSAGDRDAFIIKQDPGGGLLWAKRIGGTGRDRGLKLRTDASGNVYVLGSFVGTVDLDPGPGLSLFTSGGGGYVEDLFMIKLDASGNIVWIVRRQANNPGYYVHDCDIKLDANGNIYMCYAFGDAYATDRVIIEKAGNNGATVWNTMINNTGGSNPALMNANLALDVSGNVFVSGEFSGYANFNQNTPLVLDGKWATAYVLKLDNAGNFGWVRLIGENSNGVARGFDIATDASGNIIVAGRFLDVIDFDPGPGAQNENSNFKSKAYVLKLTNAGNFSWVRHWGETGALNNAFGVAADAGGAVYVTGAFKDSCVFGLAPNTVSFKTNINSIYEAYTVKFGSTGNLEWAQHIGGGLGDSAIGNAIAVSNMGVVYTAGSFDNTANFDVGSIGGFNLTSTGGLDGYIRRVAGCPAVNNGVTLSGSTLTATAAGATYQWLNCGTSTAVTGATAQTFTPAVTGSYAVIVMQGGCGDTSACTSVIGTGMADARQSVAAIYPNPTNGDITIDLNNRYNTVEVEITSAIGTIVSKTTYSNTQSIRASVDGASGVYFISIVADGVVIARERLVKAY